MGVLDDEYTPGTTQAVTPVTPASSSSSSTFTVSTTPTSIDVSGGSSSETLTGGSASSSSSSTSTATATDPNAPEVKAPTFTIAGNAKARGIGNVDPRLVSIMEKAAAETPYSVEVFSGLRYGSSTGSRHNTGNAVDVVLIDANGNEVPNLKSSVGFPIYRDFALKAREVQERDYPELNDAFRWGGGFSGGRGTYGAVDLMHFDIKPGGGMGGIVGGTISEAWAGGLKLTPGQEKIVAGMGPGQIYSSRGIGRAPGNLQFADFSGRGRDLGSPTAYAATGEGGAAAAAAELAAGVPAPRPRPDLASPAFGARGAGGLQGLVPTLGAVGDVVLTDKRVFGKGEEGDHVAEIQAFLNERGVTDYYGNALVVDGKFGRLTRQAVKAYQTVSQIGVDGKVGPETYQAMLYDINPGAAVMPGDAAYRDGLRTATKIVDPAAEVVPMPRMRPDNGDGVPTPRTRADYYAYRLGRSAHYRDRYNDMMLRPGDMAFDPLPGEAPPASRAFEPAAEGPTRPVLGPAGDPIAVDMAARQERARAMEAENDAYFAAQVEAGRTSRRAALIELATLRAGQGVGSQVFHEGQTGIAVDSAVSAGAAMRQRFDDAHAGADRFLPPAERPIDLGATLVRSAEAVRQFVRGIGDAYRKAIEQQRGLRPYDPFGTKSSTKDQSRVPTADAILKADPTPSSAVTTVYDFRRRP